MVHYHNELCITKEVKDESKSKLRRLMRCNEICKLSQKCIMGIDEVMLMEMI